MLCACGLHGGRPLLQGDTDVHRQGLHWGGPAVHRTRLTVTIHMGLLFPYRTHTHPHTHTHTHTHTHVDQMRTSSPHIDSGLAWDKVIPNSSSQTAGLVAV